MSHFLGTPAKSHIWQSGRSGYLLDEAKNLRDRLLSGPLVNIYVGPERKHWSLHKNLLRHHSSYFETKFYDQESNSRDGTTALELPDDEPKGFELLVKWLYQGTLEDTSSMDDEQKYNYAVACHRLHQLCDKFSMITLKNLAIDSYRSNLNAAQLVPDAEEINEIYRASSPGSPFRKLMIKIAARQIMDPDVDRDLETYRCCFENNANFSVELVQEIRLSSGGRLFEDPTSGNKCDWHDHRDGSSCNGKSKKKRARFSDSGEPDVTLI